VQCRFMQHILCHKPSQCGTIMYKHEYHTQHAYIALGPSTRNICSNSCRTLLLSSTTTINGICPASLSNMRRQIIPGQMAAALPRRISIDDYPKSQWHCQGTRCIPGTRMRMLLLIAAASCQRTTHPTKNNMNTNRCRCRSVSCIPASSCCPAAEQLSCAV
jgi:hypothetical protein